MDIYQGSFCIWRRYNLWYFHSDFSISETLTGRILQRIFSKETLGLAMENNENLRFFMDESSASYDEHMLTNEDTELIDEFSCIP